MVIEIVPDLLTVIAGTTTGAAHREVVDPLASLALDPLRNSDFARMTASFCGRDQLSIGRGIG